MEVHQRRIVATRAQDERPRVPATGETAGAIEIDLERCDRGRDGGRGMAGGARRFPVRPRMCPGKTGTRGNDQRPAACRVRRIRPMIPWRFGQFAGRHCPLKRMPETGDPFAPAAWKCQADKVVRACAPNINDPRITRSKADSPCNSSNPLFHNDLELIRLVYKSHECTRSATISHGQMAGF
jgi:hypothetical protein